jgi:hypothetical protein
MKTINLCEQRMERIIDAQIMMAKILNKLISTGESNE